jgi:hypothetical protein
VINKNYIALSIYFYICHKKKNKKKNKKHFYLPTDKTGITNEKTREKVTEKKLLPEKTKSQHLD